MLLVGFTGGELVTTEKGSYYIWIQFRNSLKKFKKKKEGEGLPKDALSESDSCTRIQTTICETL